MSSSKFNTAKLLELLSNGENKDLGRYIFYLDLCPRNSQKLKKKWPWAWYYWIDLDCNSYRENIICNIYCPPNSQPAFLHDLGDMLDLACGERKDIIIMRDIDYDILSPNSATNQLLSIMADHQLIQLITDPTRVTPNSHTIIDHCHVSSSVSVASSGTAPLAGSDHHMIYVTLPLSSAGKAAPTFLLGTTGIYVNFSYNPCFFILSVV